MTNGLKAQLEISADASGVDAGIGKAKRSLADLGATAAAVGKEASEGIQGVGEGGEKAAGKLDRATQSIIGSIQRTTAALDAGGKSSSAYFSALAAQRGVNVDALKPYLDQLDAVAAKQKIAEAALKSTPATFEKVGISAAQAANNLRMVGPQFTDIVTSLQGGQKPLTVLIQQGGQLKDIFGGIIPAARALSTYIVGLLNPLTILVGAVAAIGFAFNAGREESQAYAKALILSGNAAGSSAGKLSDMARAISNVAGTQGNAADALAQFASTGEVASASLEKVATAAIRFERSGGQAIEASVKQFAELGREPLQASIKLNESLHYLTLGTYAQIKALEEQGRVTEAATVAQEAYANALNGRASQLEANLGIIERSWRGIKDAAKLAWDAMLNVGRTSSLGDQLAAAQTALEERQKRGALNPLTQGSYEKGNQALRERIETLKESIRFEDQAARSTKAAADQVSARIRFDKDGEQFATKAAKMEREITKARNEGAAAGATQAEIEKRIADIREKYTDKGAAKTALGIDKAQLASDIDAIQKASQQLVGIYANQEKILEAKRSAGGISDSDYYAQKRELVITEVEIEQYALEQQIKRYQQEKLAGKDAIDNAKKQADTEAKLAILRADASAKLTILSEQQDAAAKRLAASFLSARQAAQDYFDNIQRQQARELSGVGQGAQQRQFDAGLNQIEDRYAGQRRDLENQKAQLELEGKFTDDARKQYEERLRIINEFQEKSVASYTDYYARLIDLQGDAALGAKEALQNYFDDAQKLGKQTENIVGKALSGVEDAFVSLATTGKSNFKSLADSIIADLIRIQVRQAIAGATGGGGGGGIAGVLGTLGSLISGSYNANYSNEGRNYPAPRAAGGSVEAGRDYWVGEQGPEILRMGRQHGMVVPSKVATAGGRLQVVMNNSGVQAAAREETQTQPDGTQVQRLVIDTVARDIERGTGRTGSALRRRMGLGPGVLARRK